MNRVSASCSVPADRCVHTSNRTRPRQHDSPTYIINDTNRQYSGFSTDAVYSRHKFRQLSASYEV